MKAYKVVRPTDTVLVTIFKHKDSKKYSFVNLTKQHICPCQFDSIEDALADMDRLKAKGKILEYKQLNSQEIQSALGVGLFE